MVRDCDPEYKWIDGVESLERYSPGGYHPIIIGDVLHERYRIVDKLGYGGYSTVWLARDALLKRYVAVKVSVADSLPNEINILRALSSSSVVNHGCDLVPSLLDEFEVHGPNGIHRCYVMTPARCDLREISYSRLFPLEVARALCYGLTLAVAYIHSRGYIHGDIHLRNVLLKLPSSFDRLSISEFYEEYGDPETVPVVRCDGKELPPNVPAMVIMPLCLGEGAEKLPISDARVLLSDFGESFTPMSEVRRGESCCTPIAMRPPEARFEPKAPLSYSADIWSLAVAIWEILGMKAIFNGEFATVNYVTSQQIDVLGPMPLKWWECWEERAQYFDENKHPKNGRYIWPPINDAFEEDVQKYRRKHGVGEFDREEAEAIIYLMRRMLVFRPKERPSADDVLKSE
ncbi:Serine/threonine-protein kinase spk-1 [Daldinia childiae]|uniref:Serine/threonine-protein kinase spk-1 n=1 Tax=Daldinia childiae TaxID=326645 RepID=UPI001446CC84|nr:Serine/threonine-protein kinase spk-1 [Daldinia childiae]KAF3057466.1 Serine/threonine-protein kinase spk-1 [Daldinia childiae]